MPPLSGGPSGFLALGVESGCNLTEGVFVRTLERTPVDPMPHPHSETPWLDRLAKEAREPLDLAPWAMRASQSRGRRFHEEPDPMRTVFERDRDRITHSTAFRRLMYKTQVFLNEEGDHNRTRLSHSLEVCQVARSLGGALRLNEPLCEALALGHDLGHPPFGHRGEVSLDGLMAEHGGFRHNAQVLRVIDRLERRTPDHAGLNLTHETRAGLLKHETERDWPQDLLPRPARPCLEAQVVDLADSTAYNKHDLEDGLLAGMFTVQDLHEGSALWRRAEQAVERRHPGFLADHGDWKLRITRVTNELLGLCIGDLIRTTHANLHEALPEDAAAVGRHDRMLVSHGPELSPEVAELHQFLYQRFYRHEHLQRFLEFAREVLAGLFAALCERPGELSPWYQRWVDEVGLERATCDYLSGMTDRFALQEYERLVGELPGGFTPLRSPRRAPRP